MPKQPTTPQDAYQHRSVQVIDIATEVMHRNGRTISETEWDHGQPEMLPESSAHTLKFRSAPTDITLTIPAHWFQEPGSHRRDIEAAVESALAA